MCLDKVGLPTAQEPLQVSGSFVTQISIPLPDTPDFLSLTTIPVTFDDQMASFQMAVSLKTISAINSIAEEHKAKAAAEDVYRTLVTEPRADRIHNPGLEEARADVIVGGMCILVQIMRTFGFDDCLVSEADILDGLVASQI